MLMARRIIDVGQFGRIEWPLYTADARNRYSSSASGQTSSEEKEGKLREVYARDYTR